MPVIGIAEASRIIDEVLVFVKRTENKAIIDVTERGLTVFFDPQQLSLAAQAHQRDAADLNPIDGIGAKTGRNVVPRAGFINGPGSVVERARNVKA